MALSQPEIDKIATVAIDFYRKNKPVDQINVERPLLDYLIPKAKDIVGGKTYLTENIYISNGANGQYWSGNSRVTYNTRSPNALAQYRWTNFHDGFTLNEDELKRAGITVNDDKARSTATPAEAVALTNMITSQMKALDQGALDFHHAAIWQDGSQATDAIPGIDALVSTTPNTGTVGGINAANATYWRNYASTGLASTLTAIQNAMELGKRAIMRTGGRIDKIYVGYAFLDALRAALAGANQTQVNYQGGSKLTFEVATNKIQFDGTPLEWVPDFDNDFGGSAPTIPWAKRCYMLDTRHLWLNRDPDDWLKMRYPGRPIDQYVYYFAKTSKFGMSCDKRNAQAVLAIS